MKKGLVKILLSACVSASLIGCSDDCDKEHFSGSDNNILSFEVTASGVTYSAAVVADEVLISVPEEVSLDPAKVKVVVSEKASLSPDPSTITNWDEDHMFVVKSYSGEKRQYIYRRQQSVSPSEISNVTLLTQADVDNFSQLKASQINGNLIIGSDTADDVINDISGLSSLKTVIYNINLKSSVNVKDLSALESLEKVGGIILNGNPNIADISLPHLTEIGVSLDINSTVVENIYMPQLRYVGSNLSIVSANLQSYDLDALQVVEGDFTFFGSANSSAENTGISIVRFPTLERIGGACDIERWVEVYSVRLDKLSSVGSIVMQRMTKVVDIDAPSLEKIDGVFTINTSPLLTDISMPELRAMGNFSASNSAEITNIDMGSLVLASGFSLNKAQMAELSGLKSLETVTGKMELREMTQLRSLSGLQSLKKVGEYSLYNLDMLDEIDLRDIEIDKLSLYGTVLSGITIKADDVFNGTIYINLASKPITELPPFEGFKVINALEITTASSLVDMSWPGLERVEGDLKLSSASNALVIAFPDLEYIGGAFNISYMNKLGQLKFPALKHVGASLTYSVSSDIPEVGFPSLESVGSDLTISAGYNISNYDFDNLTTVEGGLNLIPSSSKRNTVATDLDGFLSLKNVGSIQVTNHTALVSFEGLKNAVGSLVDMSKWTVNNNGYNPSWEDMKAGHYNKQD